MNSAFGRKINSVNYFKFAADQFPQEAIFETDLLAGRLLRICSLEQIPEGYVKEAAVHRGRSWAAI